jgi:hypothetical protein
MITIRCLVGPPQSPGGSTEPSLVGIARSLKAAQERLAALAPHTRLAEPHVQELREIRRLVAALRVTGRGIVPGPGAEEGLRAMRVRMLASRQ